MVNNIPDWASLIIDCHKAVAGDAVSHAGRLQSDRYFVWTEDFLERDGYADNDHDAWAVSGQTDLFTKIEFDPWYKQIQLQFSAHGIKWRKSGLTYEPDTGFWHYSWEWVVF